MAGRQITVGIARKHPAGEDVEDISFEDKVVIVEDAIERGVRKVIFGVLAYVIADTIRQVVISKTRS